MGLDKIRAQSYEGAKTHMLLSIKGLIGRKMAVEI